MTKKANMGHKGLFDWNFMKVAGASLASISTALTDIDLVVKVLCGVVALLYGTLKLCLLWKNRDNKDSK